MTGRSAKAFLIVFGNLLTLALGTGIFFIYRAALYPICFIVVAAHIAASAVSCRRFMLGFGITPGKYVMYGAMPAFAVSLILMFLGFGVILLLSVYYPQLYIIVYCLMFPSALSFVWAFYSFVYLVVLAVVVSFY